MAERQGAQWNLIKLGAPRRLARKRVSRSYQTSFGIGRPVHRSDCLPGGFNEARPCPYVTCRYHLAVEAKSASTMREMEGWQEGSEPTCALDVADEGPLNLAEIGAMFGLTSEAVRLIEARAKFLVLIACRLLGVEPHYMPWEGESVYQNDENA